MAKKSNIAALFFLAVIISIFISSCSEDGGTEPETGNLATVVTGVVTQIAATTAQGAGEVTDAGSDDVTGRGLCWSPDPDPTVSDSRVSAGEGLGSFSGELAGLLPETIYHLRAYATSSYGTAYGEDISFSTTPAGETVTDIDGNIYHTVTIGDQVWMVENLKVTRFSEGSSIPNVTSDNWELYPGAAYGDYLDNPDWSVDYGLLYNWAAVADPRGLAPDGWRIADDHDWKVLETTLGMLAAEAERLNWRGSDEGGKLKEIGIDHWVTPNTGATNEVGFTALPGGVRDEFGFDSHVNLGGWFWTSTIVTGQETDAWMRWLAHNRSDIFRHHYPKGSGLSVRCIKQ